MNMIEFKNYRIATDAELFRVEGLFVTGCGYKQWLPLSSHSNSFYIGCDSYGYSPSHGFKFDTFKSKSEAIEFIRTEFGKSGVDKIIKNWIPCCYDKNY